MKYSMVFLFALCMLCLLSYSRSQDDDPRPTTPEDVDECNRIKTITEDDDDDDDGDDNGELFQRFYVGEIFPLQGRRTCPPGLHGDRCPPRPTRPGQHPYD